MTLSGRQMKILTFKGKLVYSFGSKCWTSLQFWFEVLDCAFPSWSSEVLPHETSEPILQQIHHGHEVCWGGSVQFGLPHRHSFLIRSDGRTLWTPLCCANIRVIRSHHAFQTHLAFCSMQIGSDIPLQFPARAFLILWYLVVQHATGDTPGSSAQSVL